MSAVSTRTTRLPRFDGLSMQSLGVFNLLRPRPPEFVKYTYKRTSAILSPHVNARVSTAAVLKLPLSTPSVKSVEVESNRQVTLITRATVVSLPTWVC